MFTGLVEETAELLCIEPKTAGARLVLSPPSFAAQMREGDSLALNGCCLTVAEISTGFCFDLLQETLDRTNLGSLQPGAKINLERALCADSRFGGHFVQGHVDTTTHLLETAWKADDLYLRFALPEDGAVYFVSKGSIAVNGVSLTVATLDASTFGVWIIPHTRALTNLGLLQPGDVVNLEYDMLAKYVLRIVELHRQAASGA